MKTVLDIRKVAFYGKTGDNRSPEDFAFPACMTSLTEAMGAQDPVETIYAHGRSYTKRTANDAFLTVSGMAFGLLWHDEFCPSALDVMQSGGHAEAIRRAFAWAGYEYDLFERTDENTPEVKRRIVASIDQGVPVLAFNLFDPPECAMIAGYDENGDALIGWSHFQDFAKLNTEENGMFRVTGWEENWWCIVVPGRKTARSLSYADVISFGRSIMEKTEIDCYRAGLKAYDQWIGVLEALTDAEACARFYEYHNSVLFGLAELRAWGANFLREAGALEAAEAFSKIHDLCWKADAVTGAEKGGALLNPEKRSALAATLREIRAEDERAMNALRAME